MMEQELRFKKENFNKHQWEFMTSQAVETALVTGYGGGKTHAFLRKTLDKHITQKNRQGISKGLIVYPTFDLCDELFVEPFNELLDSVEIKSKYNKQNHRFTTHYGTIKMFSLREAIKIVGSEYTYVGFDEFDIGSIKNCKMAYERAVGRARGCEFVPFYFVTTPEGFKQTYKLFVEDIKKNPELAKTRKLIQGKTSENIYLPKSYIERMENSYDSKRLQAYSEGKFVNFTSGNVWNYFDRNIHVGEFDIYSEFEHYTSWDFGWQHPTVVLCIMRDNQNNDYIYDEVVVNHTQIRSIIETVKKRGYPKSLNDYCDPAGNQHHEQSGLSNIKSMRFNGLNPRFMKSRITEGIIIGNNRFEKNNTFIHSRCKYLINCLEKHSYEDTRGDIVSGKVKDDEYKDGSDALRYYFVNQYRNDYHNWTND